MIFVIVYSLNSLLTGKQNCFLYFLSLLHDFPHLGLPTTSPRTPVASEMGSSFVPPPMQFLSKKNSRVLQDFFFSPDAPVLLKFKGVHFI